MVKGDEAEEVAEVDEVVDVELPRREISRWAFGAGGASEWRRGMLAQAAVGGVESWRGVPSAELGGVVMSSGW